MSAETGEPAADSGREDAFHSAPSRISPNSSTWTRMESPIAIVLSAGDSRIQFALSAGRLIRLTRVMPASLIESMAFMISW